MSENESDPAPVSSPAENVTPRPAGGTKTLPPPPSEHPAPDESFARTKARFAAIGTPSHRTLIGVAIVGLAVDQSVRRHPNSLIGAVTVLLFSLVLLTSGSLESRASKTLVGLAPMFGIWLAIRASTSLTTFNILAIIAVWMIGTGVAKRGRFFDYRLTWLAGSTIAVVEDSIFAGPYAVSGLTSATKNLDAKTLREVLSGLFVAAPILLIVGALLAEADEQFEALFGWLGNVGLFTHILGAAVGSYLALVLVRRSNNHLTDTEIPGTKIFTPVTSLTIVASFVLLYAAFVGVQLADVLQTTFSHAEIRDYARSGFFQLLAVSVITLATFMLVPTITQEASPSITKKLRWGSVTAIGLTLVITAMAARRLVLFVQIDELTVLRYLCLVASAAIAAIFVLLALRLWGVRADRDWFLGATISVVLLVVFGLNIANPEAHVARYNLDAIGRANEIDLDYLGRLSADAVGDVAGSFAELDPDDAQRLKAAVCGRHDPSTRDGLDYNRAVADADRFIVELCTN